MTKSFQLTINNYQLAISSVAAYNGTSLIANILPIANSTLRILSKGAN